MTDTTTGAAPAQAVDDAQPQAGTDSPSQAEGAQQAQAASAAAESGTGDTAALRRELGEARREAAKYRTEATKLTDAQKAADDAKLSEAERLNKRIADLERENADHLARAQESTVRMAVLDAAARLGFRSPELAFRALERSEIEFKDDGAPRNVEKLLRELLEREPYLGKPAGAPDFGGGQRGQTSSTTPTMNELLRSAARGG